MVKLKVVRKKEDSVDNRPTNGASSAFDRKSSIFSPLQDNDDYEILELSVKLTSASFTDK